MTSKRRGHLLGNLKVSSKAIQAEITGRND